MDFDELEKARIARRAFVEKISKGVGFFFFGGLLGRLLASSRTRGMVWQIDPQKCQQCGNCATACVLTPSAVRCMHDFSFCGYCRICVGFFTTSPPALNEGAENQLCPVGALRRRYVEEPFYEYTIDRELCIGCARCVKGCHSYGNGSLFLQIQRDICINCNECSIAPVCEGNAIVRIPAEQQYIPIRKG